MKQKTTKQIQFIFYFLAFLVISKVMFALSSPAFKFLFVESIL